jgi:hypothetical protein
MDLEPLGCIFTERNLRESLEIYEYELAQVKNVFYSVTLNCAQITNCVAKKSLTLNNFIELQFLNHSVTNLARKS